MNKPALTFRVFKGSSLVGRETVRGDIVKIGRDARSHLRVDDDAASRMHAVVEATSLDQVTLIDLGNEPTTRVNGQRINKCALRAGDKIGLIAPASSFSKESFLAGCARLPCKLLSQGQKRRAALARLKLSGTHPLWVLDEPFSALDPEGVAVTRSLIEAQLARGGAVMFTTHQEVEFAGRALQRIALSS